MSYATYFGESWPMNDVQRRMVNRFDDGVYEHHGASIEVYGVKDGFRDVYFKHPVGIQECDTLRITDKDGLNISMNKLILCPQKENQARGFSNWWTRTKNWIISSYWPKI